MVLLLTLALFVLTVHECGHLVAGLWQRMTCHLFVLGPFLLIRRHGRLRLRWNGNPGLFGGAVLMVPMDDHNLKRRAAWMVAGGPLASLFLAAAGYAGHAILAESPVSSRVCGFLAICSVCIFAVTSVPFRLGTYTDGARLLMLWRGGRPAEEWCANLVRAAYSTTVVLE